NYTLSVHTLCLCATSVDPISSVSSYLKPDPGLHQRSWPRNNPLTSRNVATCCTVLDNLDPPRASVCACDAARITFLGRLGINVRVDKLLRLCRRPTTPGFRCSLTQVYNIRKPFM
ncbi:hypothetical protein F2Q68_00006349, partial [Brassica cretica]